MANISVKNTNGNDIKLFADGAEGGIEQDEFKKLKPYWEWNLGYALLINNEKQKEGQPTTQPSQPNREGSSVKPSNEVDIDVFIRRNPFNLERAKDRPPPKKTVPESTAKAKNQKNRPSSAGSTSRTRGGGSLKAIPSRRK